MNRRRVPKSRFVVAQDCAFAYGVTMLLCGLAAGLGLMWLANYGGKP